MKRILFMAMLTIAFTGCKKNDDKETVPALSGFYITFTADGKTNTYTDGVGGYLDGPEKSGSSSPTSYFTDYSTNPSSTSLVANSISIGKKGLSYTGTKPANADFSTFFNTGIYTWASLSSTGGIIVSYVDKNAKQWSSVLDTQGGSYFKILSKQERMVGGNMYVDVKGEFNCTVYEVNGSSSKQITGGSFYGTFLNN